MHGKHKIEPYHARLHRRVIVDSASPCRMRKAVLARLFTSIFFAAMLLGLAGQSAAQSSVFMVASSASPSAECMKMMMAGETENDAEKKDCRFIDCLRAMAGCPSMIASNALPAMQSHLDSRYVLRVASLATTLTGWASAPPTSPPKSSI